MLWIHLRFCSFLSENQHKEQPCSNVATLVWLWVSKEDVLHVFSFYNFSIFVPFFLCEVQSLFYQEGPDLLLKTPFKNSATCINIYGNQRPRGPTAIFHSGKPTSSKPHLCHDHWPRTVHPTNYWHDSQPALAPNTPFLLIATTSITQYEGLPQGAGTCIRSAWTWRHRKDSPGRCWR